MTHVLVVPWLVDVGRSLREAFSMFWETLWALVLGFTLSGAVQAFVSRHALERRLGDHRPAALARASGFGMASSSCSYAATALARSLFTKGADFVTSVAFMVASTNLVVELGLVLLVLLGWQFTVGEFVGGPVMIAVLAVLGTFVLAGPLVDAARRRLRHGEAEEGGHEGAAGAEGRSLRQVVRSKAGWSEAASFAVADAMMLRRELVVGYVVAGVLAVVVPASGWDALFLHGHGAWTVLENALVGPLIALASWVCSIGNVPLAASLWHGGISFGGVIAFVLGDLITFPLVLIYARYYGWRLAGRLVGVLYVAMVVAALAVHGLFSLLHAVPTPTPGPPVPSAHPSLDLTTVLNIVALAGVGVLVWLRHQRPAGPLATVAVDPVCGMVVRPADAPASRATQAGRFFYCSPACLEAHVRSEERAAHRGRC